jgi:hypothetical protein
MSQKRHILSTFDTRPSPHPAAQGVRPNELMLDWRTLPPGTTASLYIPAADAGSIASEAARLYGVRQFSVTDAHTVSCLARGTVFMPIPAGGGNFAGLIDVELPSSVRVGDKLTVSVSQIGTVSRRARGGSVRAAPRPPNTAVTWRQVLGKFQLATLVNTEQATLPTLERNLSLLRYIFSLAPVSSRWYPIFVRYLRLFADQVAAFGGDPNSIPPTPTGTWPGRSGEQNGGFAVRDLVGKIDGLIYDHFGDFEGFILEDERGRTFHFFSREEHIENIARTAWSDRLRVTVIPEGEHDHSPRRVVLHFPSPRR